MNYNLLGSSSLKVSEIAFGCMSLGDNQHDNTTLINKALDSGINFFDTADMYANGKNEEALGKLVFLNKTLFRCLCRLGKIR